MFAYLLQTPFSCEASVFQFEIHEMLSTVSALLPMNFAFRECEIKQQNK